jgi:hypothetical protein
MGTRERMLARAMADQYTGFGGNGPPARRFTVRQVGGHLVIEAAD